jgi:5-methylcytosine-specific restriction endonuclease McrA
MDQREQKIVLERFLNHHGIEMPATARLAHYGRRFWAYFPAIADKINPQGASWTSRVVGRLAEYVAHLDPEDFVRDPVARSFSVNKRTRSQNRAQAFILSREWRELRYEVLRERGRKCECCGAAPPEVRIEVDHIEPISKRWDRRLDKKNLQVLCRACNSGKSNKSADDFRRAS